MSDTPFGVIAVIAVLAAIGVAWLLMDAAFWLMNAPGRFRERRKYAGRHVARPEEPLPVLEPRQERTRWWPWSSHDDEFDGDHRDGRDVIEAVEAANEDVPGSRAQAAGQPGSDVESGHGPGYHHDDQPTETAKPVLPRAGYGEPGSSQPGGRGVQALSGHDQPTEVVRYEEPPAGAHVLLPVQGEWLPVSYEPPADLPRPPLPETSGREGRIGYRGERGPGQPHRWPRPVPHAGPAAWHPQRTWVTELVEAALGCADTDAWEQRWRWTWQQKRRLAIT
jgi:hypothetical protein